MASAVYRPNPRRAASISGEDSAFHYVEERHHPVKADPPHRPPGHRFVVQATTGLKDKYKVINEKYAALSKHTEWDRREIMETRSARETKDRSEISYRGQLGEGVYSRVYRAARRGVEAAAKLSTPAAYQHNRREAGILAKLQGSPYVPRLFHSGFDSAPREFAFVMEIVPENFWRQVLSQRQTLNLSQVRRLAYHMAAALRDFKRRSIGHADLKPENFSFDGNRLKIFDFGIAFEPGSRQNRKVQSAYYRAPEAWADQRPYTPEIDLWSVGCILFEAYIGAPLFPFKDDPDGERCFFYLLTRHIGPPPISFLRDQRTPDRIRRLFQFNPQTQKVQFAGPIPKGVDMRGIGERILDKATASGESREEAIQLFNFIRDLLCYQGRMPPERALKHPFLNPPATQESTGSA